MNELRHAIPSGTPSRTDLAPAPVSAPSRRMAEVFLESLQQRVYASVGVTAEDCQQREWIGQQTILPVRLQQKAEELSPAEFDRYRAAVFEALARDEAAPRPTPYERPHQYSILRDLKTSIEDAAAQLSLSLPFTPVFGTLPVRLLEPLMLRVPGTDEVVLVIDGTLLTYAHMLAKVVAEALPYEMLESEAFIAAPPREGWQTSIDPAGKATDRFVELMLAALAGNPAQAPSYPQEPASEQTAAALCECMELFIVGREYARLCEGDHMVADSEERSAHGQPFEALAWTAEQEVRADALGLGLMLTAATQKCESLRLAYWSADLLLASFSLIDRTLTAMSQKVALPLGLFPPTIFDHRRGALRELMASFDGGHRAVAFADALAPVFTELADRYEAALHDLRFGVGPTQ